MSKPKQLYIKTSIDEICLTSMLEDLLEYEFYKKLRNAIRTDLDSLFINLSGQLRKKTFNEIRNANKAKKHI